MTGGERRPFGHPSMPGMAGLRLYGRRVTMRPLVATDFGPWTEVRVRNEAWLTPWEPTRTLHLADPTRSRDAFMVAYRNTNWVGIDIDPAAQRTGPIGHMGYFRPSAVGLWDDVLAWFVEHEPLPAAVG